MRAARIVPVLACALSLASCATERAGAPAPALSAAPVAAAPEVASSEVAVPEVAASAVPPIAPVQPARAVQFESDIRPILEAKCSPCHFPGGKMYARLPFDRPETIRVLGTELFTRLKDESDQAIVRAFLESAPPPAAP